MRKVIMEEMDLVKTQVTFEVPDDIPDWDVDRWLCKSKERFMSAVVDHKDLGQLAYDYHIIDAETKRELIPWMGVFRH